MRRLMCRAAAALILAGTLAGARAAAVEEPATSARHLELGVGLGVIATPDYRGSSQFSTTVLPVPYVSYRDRRVELSRRDGLVARLFNTEYLRLGVSASASLPGNDSQDSLRRGMPKLLPTFEIGPSLDLRVSEAGGHWDLRLPVRAVAAADLDEFEGIGGLSYPHLRFSRDRQSFGNWEVEGAAGLGPLWATRSYHRYFYRVEPRYATPDRPAYDPPGGYSGARATAYLGLRRGPWRIGLGLTRDALAGAAFRDSPLVETAHSTVIAFGVFYALWAHDWPAPEPAAPGNTTSRGHQTP